MSHAWGEVIHDGAVVGYFEYNGTTDNAIGRIYHDFDDMWQNHWRCGDMGKCVCGKPPVGVVLYSDYGCGFHWDAFACLACRTITDGLVPWRFDEERWFGYSGQSDLIGPEGGHPFGGSQQSHRPLGAKA